MDQPDAATRQKLRIRIAELCRWKHSAAGYWFHQDWPEAAACVSLGQVPNYPEDLNAAHEAERALLADTHDTMMYQMKLEALGQGVDWPEDAHRACWKAWHAPAWLRCIALDRTLSSDPIL